MLLRNLVVIAFFTAFMYIIGLVPSIQLPFSSVPIILQNIGVFFAASILGIQGVLSILLLFLLVTLGFPMLQGGRGGIIVFTSPTGGFLIGYILAALVIGLLVYSFWPKIGFWKFFFCNIIGLVFMYIPGILWFTYVTTETISIPTLLKTLPIFLIYVPSDIIKILITCYAASKIKKYYPIIEKRNIQDFTSEHSKKQLSMDTSS